MANDQRGVMDYLTNQGESAEREGAGVQFFSGEIFKPETVDCVRFLRLALSSKTENTNNN